MKNNRRVIISLGIILILLIYLYISNNDKSQDLPDIKAWDISADEMLISKGDDSIRIFRKEGKWLLTDKEYPAEEKKINDLESRMKDLKLIDYISKGPYYERYELSPDKAIRVTVKSDSKVKRDVLIGKMSSTFRSTYIRFMDQEEVYLASGGLQNEFKKTVEDLRDKQIYKVDKDSIQSIELLYKGKKLSFSKIMDNKKDEEKIQTQNKDMVKSGKNETRWISNEYKKMKLDDKKLDSFVSSFSSIKADSFPEIKKQSIKKVTCIISGKVHDRSITLKIHKKHEKDKYLCTSSESPYTFTLREWAAKRFFKSISDFSTKK